MAVATDPALAVSIDEFDGDIATTSASFTFDDAGILGGERDFAGNANVSVAFTGGQLTYNSLTGIGGAQFFYDGDDDNAGLGFGLGGLDLTAGGADRFFVAIDSFTASNASFTVEIYEDGANSTRSGPIQVNTTGLYELLFTDLTFVTGAGADITSVNAIQFTVSDNVASGGPGNVVVDYFRTNGDMSAVPEPSSFALISLGLVAFGAWRRKQSVR